jgi:predicted GNAT family N-acyltransferase
MVTRIVTTPPEREAAYAIRRIVFQDEQKVPAEEEFDADDEVAVHVIALDDDTAIGTGRVVFHADHAKIGRMAVVREWRGRGVGRALLEALVREAARQGATRALLHAQVQAIGFYERAGFTAFGEVFDEAGIPHRRMVRRLASNVDRN